MKNTTPKNPILLVDDEPNILKGLKNILRVEGINNVILCDDSRQVKKILEEGQVSLVLTDLRMPELDGMEVLSLVKENFPQIPVIILTGTVEVNIAVKCIKMGAEDYLLKPVNKDNLLNAVFQAMEKVEIDKENRGLKKYIFSDNGKCSDVFDSIITNNARMRSVFKYVEAVAESSKPVLITGETGTGKELLAKGLYSLSNRKGELVSINVAGLDDQMFSDTLFGHKKGAFTSADAEREGLIQKAKEGVILLDEIGDLSIASQVKLLRLIQEKEYMPLGSDTIKKADVKIIASTCVDLEKKVQKGEFRKDLFYRLNFHHVHIPPLRERIEDLHLLVDHFVKKAAKDLNKEITHVDEGIFILLGEYEFSGNVRELESMIFNAVSQCEDDTLSFKLFENYASGGKLSESDSDNQKEKYSVFAPSNIPTIKEAVASLIDRALEETKGNQTQAAKLLGITQQALNKRLK